MANGQRFDRHKLTAASCMLPLGTIIWVMNVENGKSAVVTITDRGPKRELDRVLDLSEAAAKRLGYIEEGLARVVFSPVSGVEADKAPSDSRPIGC